MPRAEIPEVDFVGRDLSITLPDGGTGEVVGYIVRTPQGLDLMQRENEDIDFSDLRALHAHWLEQLKEELLSDEAQSAAARELIKHIPALRVELLRPTFEAALSSIPIEGESA